MIDLLILLVRAIASLLSGDDKHDSEWDTSVLPHTSSEPPAPPLSRDEAAILFTQMHNRASAIGNRLNDLSKQIELLSGPVDVLREIIEKERTGNLANVINHIDNWLKETGSVPSQGQIERVVRSLDQVDFRIDVLSSFAQCRADPKRSEVLADADALAFALLEPFRALAHSESFSFAAQSPVCMIADEDNEMVWFGLLPKGYPAIFVPGDFGADLFRWASIGHEIGHVIWREVPGFADEVRAKLQLGRRGRMIDPRAAGTRFDFSAPFGSWLEEIVCDAFACLMLGPSALRGFINCFANSGNIEEVLWATGWDDGSYTEHPPPHLRVLLSGYFLERIGFDAEAKTLVAEWNRIHQNPDVLYLPTLSNSGIEFSVDPFVEIGARLLDTFYITGFQSLLGRQISSIHGLEMTPGIWARVLRRAEDLVQSKRFNDAPPVVIAAAIEARARSVVSNIQISKAVKAAIIGKGIGEKKVRDSNYESPRATAGSTRRDFRAALILGEILVRPSQR